MFETNFVAVDLPIEKLGHFGPCPIPHFIERPIYIEPVGGVHGLACLRLSRSDGLLQLEHRLTLNVVHCVLCMQPKYSVTLKIVFSIRFSSIDSILAIYEFISCCLSFCLTVCICQLCMHECGIFRGFPGSTPQMNPCLLKKVFKCTKYAQNQCKPPKCKTVGLFSGC